MYVPPAILSVLATGEADGGVRSTVDQLTTSNHQIMLALLGVMATLVGGLVYLAKAYANTKVAAEQATEANRAVNNVDGPTIQANVAHLVEVVDLLVKKQDDFDAKGWAVGLGSDIDTAPRLTETIRKLQHYDEAQDVDHQHILDKLEAMDTAIAAHVKWEEEQKWDGH